MKTKYEPNYPTDHIRTSLKPSEYHPSEEFAIDILRQVPVNYLEYLAEKLAATLSDEDKKEHPMGATWESLTRILNGEEVHGRYLMGAALYVAYTLFNIGATCTQVLQAMENSGATVDFKPVEVADSETEAGQSQD